MSIIGTFIRNENGFTGGIKTLCLDVNAKLVPIRRTAKKGLTSASWSEVSNSAQDGRKPQRTGISSAYASMIQALVLRSTPTSLKPTTPIIS